MFFYSRKKYTQSLKVLFKKKKSYKINIKSPQSIHNTIFIINVLYIDVLLFGGKSLKNNMLS